MPKRLSQPSPAEAKLGAFEWLERRRGAVPVSDLDIHRAANLIMKQHGDGAVAHARSRIAVLSAAGDAEGVAAWARIVVAIAALKAPGSGHAS